MIDRERLAHLRPAEEQTFVERTPGPPSWRRAARSLLAGVPMPWMTRWAGAFPVFVDDARGAGFTDVDGNDYVDLCLGDTGAMTGHALPAVADALQERAQHGFTTMLPSSDAAWVGERAGAAVRAAALAVRDVGHRRQPVRAPLRPLPHRPAEDLRDGLVLPRHGRRDAGRARRRPCRAAARRARPAGRRRATTRVVPFNDIEALDRALAHGDVAARAHGARTDEHRDRAARGGLPRRRSARSPAATTCCWSSTRRTRSAPVPAAPPAPGGSTPTCSWWASRSAAACRWRRTA